MFAAGAIDSRDPLVKESPEIVLLGYCNQVRAQIRLRLRQVLRGWRVPSSDVVAIRTSFSALKCGLACPVALLPPGSSGGATTSTPRASSNSLIASHALMSSPSTILSRDHIFEATAPIPKSKTCLASQIGNIIASGTGPYATMPYNTTAIPPRKEITGTTQLPCE